MSSRAGKMEKQILEQTAKEAEQNVKSIYVRVDIELSYYGDFTIEKLSTFMTITGVPKDLPSELEDTVIKQAKRMFAEGLSNRLYMEFYPTSEQIDADNPIFYNLSRVKSIKVINIKKID